MVWQGRHPGRVQPHQGFHLPPDHLRGCGREALEWDTGQHFHKVSSPAVRLQKIVSGSILNVILLTKDRCRIIFIFVLLTGSLVHWHWKASIISHLAVSKPSLPFTTSQQLIESDYQVEIRVTGI
jgi:hypothetical protein